MQLRSLDHRGKGGDMESGVADMENRRGGSHGIRRIDMEHRGVDVELRSLGRKIQKWCHKVAGAA